MFIPFADSAILAAANLWLIVRHPRNALRFWLEGHGAPLFATPRSHAALVHWRKYVDHNPLFVTLTDKLAAKDWARARGVEAARIVWRGGRPEDIPAEFIDARHVIKTNHGWGYGQWAYDQIDPEIFVEQLVEATPLWEMTFRCHDGLVASWYIARAQKTAAEQNAFFDADDNRLPTPLGWSESEILPADFEPPAFVSEARQVARHLSRGLDYVRVDLMWDGDRVLLGEMTLYPGAGFGAEARARIAPLIEPLWLSKIHLSWFLSTAQPWPQSLYAEAFRKWVALRRAQF